MARPEMEARSVRNLLARLRKHACRRHRRPHREFRSFHRI